MITICSIGLVLGTIISSRNLLPLDEKNVTLRSIYLPTFFLQKCAVGFAVLISLILSIKGTDVSFTHNVIFNLLAGISWVLATAGFKIEVQEIAAAKGVIIPPPNIYQGILLGSVFFLCLVYPSFFIGFFAIVSIWYMRKFNCVSATEIYLPHKLSCFLVTYYIVAGFVVVPVESVVFAIVAITGSHYFYSGYGKYKMNWERINQLGNIAIAAKHQNDWNLLADSFLFPLFRRISPLLQIMVIFVEMTVVFSGIDYRWSLFSIGFLALMHLGIFLATGIFFWKWLIFLIPVGYIVYDGGVVFTEVISSVPLVLSYLGTIALSFLLSSLPKLVWFDSPLSHKIRWTLVSSTGNESYTINPYDVRPWDMSLSQARLGICYPHDPVDMMGCLGALKPPEINTEHYIADFVSPLRSISVQSLPREAFMSPRFVKDLMDHLGSYDQFTAFQNLSPRDQEAKEAEFQRQLQNMLAQLNTKEGNGWYIPNFHIWNGMERDNKNTLRKIMQEKGFILKMTREVFFYSNYHNESFKIHESSCQFRNSGDNTP